MSHRNRNTPLDLGLLIGSPLTALIEAQSHADHATLAYLRTVGFDGDQLRTTSFKLGHQGSAESGARPGHGVEMTVPNLSLMAIPNLRIAEAFIEFHAKVVSLSRPASQTDAAGGGPPLRLQAALTHRRRSHRGEEATGEYSMKVKLRVVQDELAPGLEQLVHKSLAELPRS